MPVVYIFAMVKEITLGEFEQLVLLALIRLGDEAYGVSVSQEIEARTGREASLGSVYKALMRLEQKKLVASRVGDPTPERGGRRKKFYAIRPEGRAALAAALKALRRMTRGLDPAWGSP
jgi:PadR family transcriptional regulator PadR